MRVTTVALALIVLLVAGSLSGCGGSGGSGTRSRSATTTLAEQGPSTQTSHQAALGLISGRRSILDPLLYVRIATAAPAVMARELGAQVTSRLEHAATPVPAPVRMTTVCRTRTPSTRTGFTCTVSSPAGRVLNRLQIDLDGCGQVIAVSGRIGGSVGVIGNESGPDCAFTPAPENG